MTTHGRELTRSQKRDIRRLVTTMCATYDSHIEGCSYLDGTCYMFTIAFTSSYLCQYFKKAVLPEEPALEAVFTRKSTKPCLWCNREFTPKGRKSYCSERCADRGRKAVTAARVRKHRRNKGAM